MAKGEVFFSDLALCFLPFIVKIEWLFLAARTCGQIEFRFHLMLILLIYQQRRITTWERRKPCFLVCLCSLTSS